ncbi:hypothetical protein OESDEN_11063 [Oesophagostomum dentatum]|uniref:Uncharacterized protein n=1 Tax=Oesophagostomum dentatum TaxID=61180 RepID=A0A0B1SVZ2_OESDE|nr:hypothetical protein OESDEN_11063 [Oesophagostomum dentatum]
MLEHPSETENRPPSSANRGPQVSGTSEEENCASQVPTSPAQKEEGAARPRTIASPPTTHRAEALYNWTPTDRNLRFDKETSWRGRTVNSNEQSRRFNRYSGGFREAALVQGSQW